MRAAIAVSCVVLVLALGICFGGSLFIHGALDKLEELRMETLERSDAEDEEGALESLTKLAEVWCKYEPYLEMLTSHEDVHRVLEEIVSAKALYAREDIAQYEQSMALLGESIEHIRKHESVSLSNIF